MKIIGTVHEIDQDYLEELETENPVNGAYRDLRELYLPMLAKFYLLYLYTLTYILFKLLLAAMDVHVHFSFSKCLKKGGSSFQRQWYDIFKHEFVMSI